MLIPKLSRTATALCVLLAFAVHPTLATEYRAASAAEITKLAEQLRPGDVVVMVDGVWKDQVVVFQSKGTEENPITLRAATPGAVILSGASSLTLDGEHLVASGLAIRDGGTGKDGVALKGRHCRLTETSIVAGNYKFFVHLFGSENRVDHCYLAGKTTEGPTLQVEVEGTPNHHHIDHNHFGPRPPLGRNGGESMRVGYSHQSMNNSGTLVEANLFDRCDGENEIVSNKSCENAYRGNTFRDCGGLFTLRHGNRCIVEGNFFFGQHKRGSGGIRVIGEDHTVINNYIDGVEEGGFWITSGVPNSPLNAYFQAQRCLVAFNTVVDSRGPCVDLSAGLGTSNRTLLPADITIANNVFVVPKNGTLLKGREGVGWRWLGNVTLAAGEPAAHAGVRALDPKLELAGDGVRRPAPDSPVRGAAEGDFPAIKTDLDGQPRAGRLDVGCDQLSDAPITSRPLTSADVGPSWLDRHEHEKPPQS